MMGFSTLLLTLLDRWIAINESMFNNGLCRPVWNLHWECYHFKSGLVLSQNHNLGVTQHLITLAMQHLMDACYNFNYVWKFVIPQPRFISREGPSLLTVEWCSNIWYWVKLYSYVFPMVPNINVSATRCHWALLLPM